MWLLAHPFAIFRKNSQYGDSITQLYQNCEDNSPEIEKVAFNMIYHLVRQRK